MPVIAPLQLTITPFTALYTNAVSDAIIGVGIDTQQGRTQVVLDFNGGAGLFSRDLETAFEWPLDAGTVLYTWQPALIPVPENTYNRATDWIDCAGGTGFIQGVIIEADSFTTPKVFQLQDSDTLALHDLNEVGTGVAFNGQSIKSFSCVSPFIAHSFRVVTTDGVPWRVWGVKPVYIPFPEANMGWTTELTALGGVGWQHLREVNIEYISSTPITITFAVDTGNGSFAPVPLTVPSSGGAQTKLKLEPNYNKWKLLSVSATSTAPFYLFTEGMEFKVRSWGLEEPYRHPQPFGGASAPGAQV